ncbi:hypothetical protein L6164_029007 [Bauhinia variegata]|uniref:Uncharacterized protein n=1 Tax=Bauhinia variegata TaxID=167791 RepID=A0ACB9L8E0_BAUVA|nr:hypothetical protein L6164_029007 [Bauhinia variegata]
MDFSNSAKIVYDRIQKFEPEKASKIIGYLMLRSHGEHDMIRLAFCSDNMIQSEINKAMIDLGLSKPVVSAPISPIQVDHATGLDLPRQLMPLSPVSSNYILSPSTVVRSGNKYWDSQVPANQQLMHNVDFVSPAYSDSFSENYLQNQMQHLNLETQVETINSVGSDFSSNYHYTEPALGVRTRGISPSMPEFPVKVCQFFNKGYCKRGNNCRYFHGHSMPESFSPILSPYLNEVLNEEQVFSPWSLGKLEMELTELLKSRRGFPVSIASLPMLYNEKYGKTLQAEGYLTESQRHGKVGYSLTKLLDRMKNSICLIDRPHGQHSVVLAEDVPKYLEYCGERGDPGGMVASSHQIYLTFPPDSTFHEQDVSNYFNTFGPVQDVRIPCQQKRMFGFVTFVYAETVRKVLAKGNPHFVVDSRVLVKPYREKSRLVDRKLQEKINHAMCYRPQFVDGDSEHHLVPQACDQSRILGKVLMEDYEHAVEREGKRISPKSMSSHPYFGLSLDELKLSEEGQMEFPTAEQWVRQ